MNLIAFSAHFGDKFTFLELKKKIRIKKKKIYIYIYNKKGKLIKNVG